MFEVIGMITVTFILAFLMRGAYFIVDDAQKRYEQKKK